jgi:hypothetical protein
LWLARSRLQEILGNFRLEDGLHILLAFGVSCRPSTASFTWLMVFDE